MWVQGYQIAPKLHCFLGSSAVDAYVNYQNDTALIAILAYTRFREILWADILLLSEVRSWNVIEIDICIGVFD